MADDLYDGQTIDARLASDAWLQPGFSDPAWSAVSTVGLRRRPAGRVRRPAGGPAGRARAGRDLDLAERQDLGRLRPEPRRLAEVHRHRRARPDHHPAARRGAGERRARRPAAAARQGDRPADPERRRGRLRAHLHLPRVPLCRGLRLAGRAHADLPGGGRGLLRPDADRRLRVLGPDAQPAAPQRGLGPARQLPRRADRLPAARRAARLDRRPGGLLPDRGLLVRQRRLPARLAARPRCRAARRRRHGALRGAGRDQVPAAARRVRSRGHHLVLERRRRLGAVGVLAGLRRPGGAGRGLSGHDRAPPPGRGQAVGQRPVGHAASSSRTGWTRTRRRRTRPRPRRTGAWCRPRPSTAAP